MVVMVLCKGRMPAPAGGAGSLGSSSRRAPSPPACGWVYSTGWQRPTGIGRCAAGCRGSSGGLRPRDAPAGRCGLRGCPRPAHRPRQRTATSRRPVSGAFPALEGFVLLTISIHGGRIAPHQLQAPLASDKNSLSRCAGNVKHHHDHVPPARYAAFSRSVCSSSVRVFSIMSAICCWVLWREAMPTLMTSVSW